MLINPFDFVMKLQQIIWFDRERIILLKGIENEVKEAPKGASFNFWVSS